MLARRTAALVELQEGDIGAVFEDAPGQPHEHTGWPNLHERPHARSVEFLHDPDPTHRLRHLPDQAAADGGGPVEGLDRRAAVERHARRADRQAADGEAELLGRCRQQWRMEWAGHGKPLRLQPARLDDHFQGVDDAGRAAHHELLRGILGAHPDLPGERLEGRQHRGPVGDHREHRAVAWPVRLHCLRPGSRRPGTILQRPGTDRRQRRKLAKTVAGHHVGRESQLAEHAPGEQIAEIHRPLCVPDPRAKAVVRLPGDLGQCLETGTTGQRVESIRHTTGLGRLGAQRAEHVGVLRALAGKDRRHQRTSSRRRPHVGRRSRHRRPSFVACDPRGRRQHETVVEHDVAHLPALRHRHAPRPPVRAVACRNRQHLRGRRKAVDAFAWRLERGRSRQRSRRQSAHKLDDAGGTRRGACMTDEAVERSGHRNRGPACRRCVVRSQLGELSVGQAVTRCNRDLHGTHRLGPDGGLLAGLADHAPRRIGGVPCRADGHAADHAANLVAGRAGIGQPLEHEHHRTLAGHVPTLAAAVEHRAHPVGEHAAQRPTLVGHEIHAALAGGADHGVAGPLAKHIDGRRQRRHAGAIARVECQRPAHQVERLGESAGKRAAREAASLVDERRHPLQDLFLVRQHDPLGVGDRHAPRGQRRTQVTAGFRQSQTHLQLVGEIAPEQRAHDHARAGAVESRLGPAGVSDRRVRRLQKHELQGVGGVDLLRWHLVPPPVVAEAAHEATQPRGGVPRPRLRRVDGPGGRPAVGGHRPDRALPAVQSGEELVERQRPRQDAPGTHDGDGLRVGIGVGGNLVRACPARSRGLAGNVLGQGDVDVEAADPEGVDRGTARRRVGVPRPGDRLQRHRERPGLPVELLVELRARRTRRDHIVLHGEHNLDEAGDTGRLQRVADVRLHAADGNLAALGQMLRHQPRKGAEFRGVAHLGARGMSLDIFEPADISGVGIGPLHGQHLPLLPRSPQALALAVAGHAQAADHGPDAVAVGHCARESLDHDRHVAFRRDQAVSVGAERARTHVAHRLGRREEHEAVRLAVRSAAHDRLIDAALEQGPRGDRHRLQRRGTGRIHHEIGAVEPHRLLDDLGHADRAQLEPPAGLTGRVAVADCGGLLGRDVSSRRAEQRLGGFDLGEQCGRLIDAVGIDDVADPGAAAGVPHVYAGAAVGRHRERIQPRIPAGLRRHLEKDVVRDVEPVHEIGRQRADRRIDGSVRHHGTHLRVALADAALVWIEVQVARQARLGKRSPGGPAVRHQLPEGLQPIGSREAAGHAHDRERFVQRRCPWEAVN